LLPLMVRAVTCQVPWIRLRSFLIAASLASSAEAVAVSKSPTINRLKSEYRIVVASTCVWDKSTTLIDYTAHPRRWRSEASAHVVRQSNQT
jgi:hypothetical protein